MTVGSENSKKYVQKRTTLARKRAQFAGTLYFLGTLALAVLAFMPLTTEIGWAYGTLGLTTFWKPFLELEKFSSNLVGATVNVLAAVLYGLPLLICVFGAFFSLAKLDNLFMKGNRRIGYNQNYLALKKMAKIFSAAYASISVCSLCLMLISGATWTYLFYFASLGFLLIHFISGMVGGTVSRFSLENGFVETPRKYGLFSVFFRNLVQFAAYTALVYFFISINWIPMVFDFLKDGFFASISSMTFAQIVDEFAFPIAEVVILLLMFMLFRHACNPTEFDIDGPKAKGRKTVRFAAFNILLISLAMNGIVLYLATNKNFEALNRSLLYISGITFVLFVLECIMGKCPRMKKKYRNALDPDPIPLADLDEAPALEKSAPTPAPTYCCPFSGTDANGNVVTPVFEGLSQGGIYIQPDGSQVMVLPILGNAAMTKPAAKTEAKRALTEHEKHVRAVTEKWIRAAREPVQEDTTKFNAAAYVEANKHLLPKEEPVPVQPKEEKEWQVKCPECGALHNVTKTEGTVTCKKCGAKFDLYKWKKA
ncbi:MAG: hypothetical protein IJX81_04725 [Clostridia bacterium]|nr:hypothetical protein [Clostridia bacterium]